MEVVRKTYDSNGSWVSILSVSFEEMWLLVPIAVGHKLFFGREAATRINADRLQHPLSSLQLLKLKEKC